MNETSPGLSEIIQQKKVVADEKLESGEHAPKSKEHLEQQEAIAGVTVSVVDALQVINGGDLWTKSKLHYEISDNGAEGSSDTLTLTPRDGSSENSWGFTLKRSDGKGVLINGRLQGDERVITRFMPFEGTSNQQSMDMVANFGLAAIEANTSSVDAPTTSAN